MSDCDCNSKEDKKWHLEKKVTIGHLFTTVTVAVGVLMYMGKIETTLSLHTFQINHLEFERQESDKKIESQFNKIESFLTRIEDKLDRKVDKANRQ